MTDDPAQAAAESPAPIPFDEPEPLPAAYVQLTEITAPPTEAVDAIERRDSLGRIPVVVRVRRQPPIKPVWILVAIGLIASGAFLDLAAALRAMLIVGAVVAVVVGLLSRIFLRVPPGAVGLTVKGGKYHKTLPAGVHAVLPTIALTHLVTTREIAFDVPVANVRSSDGVGVSVDLMLTLAVADPIRFAYEISTGDSDQLVTATAQDAVRLMVRATESLAALDLGDDAAELLRTTIDAKLEAYGIDAKAVAFTRVALPEAFTASLEARRLAAVQLAEQSEAYELEKRRLADHASLVAQEAQARRAAVEHDAVAEEIRLARLEERLGAHPNAARYDLELSRLRVAQALAGNSRAVVSLGAGDLVSSLLTAREAADAVARDAAVATSMADPAGEANGTEGATTA